MEIETKWFAVVNPVAGSGHGKKEWDLIAQLLTLKGVKFEMAFTRFKYHAVELTVEAISNGYDHLIAVGGDGTVNEVVNGIFIQDKVPHSDVTMAVIGIGTGNDWLRTFGITSNYDQAIEAIAQGKTFRQDIGVASYQQAGFFQKRYIANVAGVGFDAFVIRYINHKKECGHAMSKSGYMLYTLKSLFRYHNTRMKIEADGEVIADRMIMSANIGVCKFNGGGMMQVPYAVADDGLFDVTIIGRMNKLHIITSIKQLYNGRIYDIKQVSHHRARKIRIESTPNVLVEVDGEALGESPFEFEILPLALSVIVTDDFLKESACPD